MGFWLLKKLWHKPTDSVFGGVRVWGYGGSLSSSVSLPTPTHPHTPIQNAKVRTRHRRFDWRSALVACLLTLFTLGCEESVDVQLEINRPFTVFGIINPKADTHGVRVFEIQSEIRLIRPEPIDATVTTTLMQTGTVQAWQDSVIQLADGDYRHVYWAAFPATAGETYRLDITRSDGETSTAVTTIPPPVTLEVLEPEINRVREAKMPVLIRGNPPAMPRIDVEYVVVGTREDGSEPIFKPVTFNYIGRPTRQADGWLLEIDLIEDFRVIFQIFDEDEEVTSGVIDLREIEVRFHIGDENWVSPVGVFDGEFLVEPGIFSNVENGFGYFGAGYVETIQFRPPFILLERAGFFTGGARTP